MRQEQRQILEMKNLIHSVQASVYESVKTRKKCSDMDGRRVFRSHLGVLTLTGSVRSNSLKFDNLVLRTGCKLEFRFAEDGVSENLMGKEFSFNLYNNSKIM